jgi:hypothetical protein
VRPEPIERARRRLADAERGSDPAVLEATVERARAALREVAEQAAELQATMPDRLDAAIRDGLTTSVLPVGRQIAEMRGLSNRTIRGIEGLQLEVAAERRARVEDLAVLVDLVTSGWQGVERRLDRLERSLDRLERTLEERPVAELYRLEDRPNRRPS